MRHECVAAAAPGIPMPSSAQRPLTPARCRPGPASWQITPLGSTRRGHRIDSIPQNDPPISTSPLLLRSSAKVMASTGESALLVRQYLDTRRSHATIVVDDQASAWADPEDFETAMAVAASIAVRAVLDEFDVSFVCGRHASTGSDGHLALDAVCRAELGDSGLVESGRQATMLAPDTSLAFLVGGSGTEFTDLLARFHHLNAVVIGVSPDPPILHQIFMRKYDLKLTLLSDQTKETLKAYGAWQETKVGDRKVERVLRSTFLIDPDGTIAWHWPEVIPQGHAERVRDRLAKISKEREKKTSASR